MYYLDVKSNYILNQYNHQYSYKNLKFGNYSNNCSQRTVGVEKPSNEKGHHSFVCADAKSKQLKTSW